MSDTAPDPVADWTAAEIDAVLSEQDADVINRNHPGYQRRCIYPACAAAFNILDFMDPEPGAVSPGDWHHAPRIFQGYLCPDHWRIADEHRPEWVRVGTVVTGCRCHCDRWMWLPAFPVTLGGYQDRYLQHLVAITAELLDKGDPGA